MIHQLDRIKGCWHWIGANPTYRNLSPSVLWERLTIEWASPINADSQVVVRTTGCEKTTNFLLFSKSDAVPLSKGTAYWLIQLQYNMHNKTVCGPRGQVLPTFQEMSGSRKCLLIGYLAHFKNTVFLDRTFLDSTLKYFVLSDIFICSLWRLNNAVFSKSAIASESLSRYKNSPTNFGWVWTSSTSKTLSTYY